MQQDQETLGRYLKRERETRHVTVEEIALFNGVQKSLSLKLWKRTVSIASLCVWNAVNWSNSTPPI